jgi:hypothetical protein
MREMIELLKTMSKGKSENLAAESSRRLRRTDDLRPQRLHYRPGINARSVLPREPI